MKKLIVCLFIAVAAIAPSSAQNGVTINEGIITGYFNASIGDEDAQFDDESIIPAGEIASIREKIWNLWKSAVENYDEEKLIPLDILENRKSGSWELPSSLEPNATMPYYYGCNEYPSYNADSIYPLFLYMHGSGDKAQEWETGIGLSLRRFYSPGIYFVPQPSRQAWIWRITSSRVNCSLSKSIPAEITTMPLVP